MAVVLAGGRSERFGRDKAMEPVGGTTLGRHVYHTVASVIRDVRIGLAEVTQRNPVEGAETIVDEPAGSGPVGSLRAALRAAHGRWVFTAACDLPGLDPDTVRRILDARSEAVDAVVAEGPDGRRHPLTACWHPRVLVEIDRRLADGQRSLTGLLDAVRTVSVPVPEASVRNVNRPEDLPDPHGT